MLTETANHVSPDMPEDGSMHESLTMEQFNSPLVSPQYKSTYAIVATSGEFLTVTFFYSLFRSRTGEKFMSLDFVPLVFVLRLAFEFTVATRVHDICMHLHVPLYESCTTQ